MKFLKEYLMPLLLLAATILVTPVGGLIDNHLGSHASGMMLIGICMLILFIGSIYVVYVNIGTLMIGDSKNLLVLGGLWSMKLFLVLMIIAISKFELYYNLAVNNLFTLLVLGIGWVQIRTYQSLGKDIRKHWNQQET